MGNCLIVCVRLCHDDKQEPPSSTVPPAAAPKPSPDTHSRQPCFDAQFYAASHTHIVNVWESALADLATKEAAAQKVVSALQAEKANLEAQVC